MENREFLNLYREAHAFLELSKLGLNNHMEKVYVEGSIPYIVNMSFASELYLKLILIYNGKDISKLKNKEGHQLYNLYNLLLEGQKKQIYNNFKKPMTYNIENELKDINTAFVGWRYLVLDKSLGTNIHMSYRPYFMLEFNEILDKMSYSIVVEKNPNFKDKIL